jgi:hypothetical protein
MPVRATPPAPALQVLASLPSLDIRLRDTYAARFVSLFVSFFLFFFVFVMFLSFLFQLMGPKMMWILQHIAFSLYGIIRIFAVLSNLQMLASTKRPLLLLPLKDEFVALVTKLFSELYN